jgi:predicted metal-dependent hydrolase
MGKSAFYVYKIHETVNKKLSTQRIEAFIEKQTNWTLDQKSFFRNSSLEMFQDATIKPFHSPTMEVLKKRFLVNREESLSWRNLSTSLLAIVMALQEHTEPLKYKSELETFLKALRSVVLSAKQYNSTSIVQVLDALLEQKSYEEMRTLLENAKYSPIIPAVYSDVKVITNLVKAGACIENTCT